eukprot:1921083-Pyramimonas_sp.AAC.1
MGSAWQPAQTVRMVRRWTSAGVRLWLLQRPAPGGGGADRVGRGGELHQVRRVRQQADCDGRLQLAGARAAQREARATARLSLRVQTPHRGKQQRSTPSSVFAVSLKRFETFPAAQ